MIHINLHNYEEFFLLYADGELDAAGRLAVEQFVQANPDLAVELDLLLQLHLTGEENIIFADKSSLLRNEAAAINLQNCEEKFLLYVDNELTVSDREEVEKFVLQHPQQQQAFTMLKQSRLVAETITYPDKTSLYRKEEKERPVLYMRWQRIAVAAVFAGVAILIWTLLPQQNSTSSFTAKRNNAVEQNKMVPGNDAAINNKANNAITGDGNITASIDHSAATASNDQNNNNASSNILPASSVTIAEQAASEVSRNSDLIAKADPVTVLQRNDFETVSSRTIKVSGDNNVMETMNEERAHTAEENLVKYASLAEESKPTVYRELDTESADQRKSLLLGSVEINKDKLRGFFRKAGSIFRGKGKAEEDNTAAPTTRSLK